MKDSNSEVSATNVSASERGSAEAGGKLSDDAVEFAHRVFDLVRDGNTNQLAATLEAGLPPDIRTSTGDSLLLLACYHGHLETARSLLAYGADPELTNDRNQTPLAGVVFKDDKAIVNLLLEQGADVNGGPAGAKTPLMYAALFNRGDILKCLLERGADPAHRDADGKSALDLALAMGSEEAEALLVNRTI